MVGALGAPPGLWLRAGAQRSQWGSRDLAALGAGAPQGVDHVGYGARLLEVI